MGFGIGKISEKGTWQLKLAQTQEELDWLKSILTERYPPLPEEIYRLWGNVKEVGDNFLVMESKIQVSQFPLPEEKHLETRSITVNISPETEIFRTERREVAREPEILKIFLNLKDIKIGDLILVTSQENIKDKTEIFASQIEVSY